MNDPAFARLALETLAHGDSDLLAISQQLHLPLSILAGKLDGSIPFTVEEAMDLCRISDSLILLKWVMTRLGAEMAEPSSSSKLH